MEVVEEEMAAVRMEGVELFLLTNNSVAETVYYQVNSSDKNFFS